jgi:hypothetical protein
MHLKQLIVLFALIALVLSAPLLNNNSDEDTNEENDEQGTDLESRFGGRRRNQQHGYGSQTYHGKIYLIF